MKNYFIKTEHLGFSTWHKDDINYATELWTNKDVIKYIAANKTYSQTQIAAKLEFEVRNLQLKKVQFWPIFELESLNFIGVCGIRPIKGNYEVGIQLLPSYWNKGYATEALNAISDYAFNELVIKKLVATVHPEHEVAKKIFESLGYTKTKKVLSPPTGLMYEWYELKRC